MDYPTEVPEPRRGRSHSAYLFNTHAAGPPITSKEPYDFLGQLRAKNLDVMILEETDWIYRAESPPGSDDNDSDIELLPVFPRGRRLSFARRVRNPGLDSSPEGYSDRDTDRETDRDSSPERRDSSPEGPSDTEAALSEPEDHAAGNDSPESHSDKSPASSPPPLEAVLAARRMHASPDISMDLDATSDGSISPTVSDFLAGALTDVGSSTTGTPKTIITYLSRDKNRFHGQGQRLEQDRMADIERARSLRQQEQDALDAAHACQLEDIAAITAATSPRRSRRLRTGRPGDSTEGDVWTCADLLALEFRVHTFVIDEPRPLIDAERYVIGLIAVGPKGDDLWWSGIIGGAFQEMRRLYRRGNFSELGEGESFVRAGIDYGDNGPFIIKNLRENRHEVYQLIRSHNFQAIPAHQNHLYRQFAPNLFAHTGFQHDRLREHGIHPPFKHSVFSTVEWSFSDAASPARSEKFHLFYTWCAITAIGKYPATRGGLILWKDENCLPFIPGTTVIFPASCNPYSFVAVKGNEQRYYFKQYFNAGAVRWFDNGEMSDAEFERHFDEDGDLEHFARVRLKREERGGRVGGLYTKVDDLFVF